jgi:hypothetical protein
MLKNNRTVGIVAGSIASLALCGRARAEFFDFDPGMGDPIHPSTGNADGNPLDWYYQHIALEYGAGWTDGRMDTTYHDSPYGNNPYFILDGTDRSSAGTCLQVAINPASLDEVFPYNITNLHVSVVDAAGNDRDIIHSADMTRPDDSYTTFRVWIQNDGSSLYWHIKIADMDGDGGSWHQAANLNIWYLYNKTQADCTVNAHNAFPSLLWATFIGHTGSYTACTLAGGCFSGG